MTLIAYGLNHLTAPVALREKVAFNTAELRQAMNSLADAPGVEEALILSTCNRTELYCRVALGAESVPAEWLHEHHCLKRGKLDEFLVSYRSLDVVRHLFRVATGLESMVIGEPQILGQIKQAYRIAKAVGSLKTPLDRLLQNTFAVAKRVRTDTRIGANPVSVAYTAVRLAERMFIKLEQANVLLVGAGETIELAARHLMERKVKRIIVANRTLENAHTLAQRIGGYAIALNEIRQHLAEADIVITCTASRDPVIYPEMVADALSQRRHRPMFLLDLAVPRDIDARVASLNDVFLYDIDALQQVIDKNMRSREASTRDAEVIIELQVSRFQSWLRALDAHNPVRALRASAERQRDEVLARAQSMLKAGKNPDEILHYLANTLTNKLMHTPSAGLRSAAETGDVELLHAAARLYGCPASDELQK